MCLPCSPSRLITTLTSVRLKETIMNLFRLFAFAAALVITVFLFGAFSYGLTAPQPTHAAAATAGTKSPAG